ncbi:hypothetical protein BZL41_17045 [Pseudomonas sp. PIC25]|uniref:GIY-YIG nuclease family protein n=1 Tax=Pseudomonas sp. PIC25 TaxID=1958773 RepID=UPI000BABF3C0|nr:GIY-YIG nuclease family protein [Pseudomonas sp. PIC25]PAU59207.1 hypothetical protein BZL41_17045 [Pseudomonas sp. PIC25]
MNDASLPIKPGIIYILRNAAYRETVVKIGRTSRTSELRAGELGKATGVPLPFEVLYEEAVSDCKRAESLIHERLSQFRMNKLREFFDVPLKDAVRAVFEMCLLVNSDYLRERSRLAIWIQPDTKYIGEFLEWLETTPKGATSVRVIAESPRTRSEWMLSNTLLVECTPDALKSLREKPWVRDMVYVSR